MEDTINIYSHVDAKTHNMKNTINSLSNQLEDIDKAASEYRSGIENSVPVISRIKKAKRTILKLRKSLQSLYVDIQGYCNDAEESIAAIEEEIPFEKGGTKNG